MMKEINNNNYDKIYKSINSDFYDSQVKTINPLRKWFHVNRYRIINNLVKSRFRNGMKILDLGCGSCNWNIDGLDVFGIDLNEGLLKLAKAKDRVYDYKIADVCNTGIVNEAFDIVIASELLEHIYDYDGIIQEINRILRPGGFAIISVPLDTYLSLWKYLFFIQCLFQGFILKNIYYRKRCGHIHSFSVDRLREVFLRHDFDIDIIFVMRRLTIFLVMHKKGLVKPNLLCDDFTVILPTLNEGPNIKDLLSCLTSHYKRASIIVADDGSRDNTKEIVASFQSKDIFFLDRKDARTHGLTASVLEAIKLVKTKYFIVMDADGQHPWQAVGDLINHLRLGDKLVISSRIKVAGEWPLGRKIVSYLGTALGKLSLLMKNKVYLSYDILSGFFGAETIFWKEIAFHKDNISKFRLKGYKVLFDFLKIMSGDVRFGEVYYEFNARKKASSKLNSKVYLEYLKSALT